MFRPQSRAAPPLPRWALALAAPALVIDLFAKHWISVPLAVASVVGLFALAIWAECVVHRRLPDTRPLRRLAIAFLVPLGGGFGAVVAAALLSPLGTGAATLAFLFGIACTTAAFGTLDVVTLDVLAAWIPSFRRRLQTVAALLLTGTALSTGFAAWLAFSAGATLGTGGVSITSEYPVEAIALAALRDDTTLFLAQLGFATVLIFPAFVSAAGKLGDAATERLEPLRDAFVMLGRGSRALSVEPGGSREFRELATAFNAMVSHLAEAERMEKAFGVYVSGQVLERIRAQHGAAEIPAALREASVFFADIRGFTAMSEKLSPGQVVAILNRWFERVVAIVSDYDGYLNKFVGDAVVVVFNGPIDQPDHAARAARCAMELQKEALRMNAARAFPEIGELRVGIGVATGPMVCGNVGGSRQMEYTVIGDTVNLASRLTSKAETGEVLVAEATARAAELPYTALEPVQLKGKEQPVTPCRVWPAPAAAA